LKGFNMDKLQIDFRTHSRTLTGDRGVFYEATNRALIILPNHECVEDIISTLQHETIHFCIKDDDNIDEEHEEEVIYRMAWADLDLV
tara:strand:+ start:2254 stop:2514 length:261 start_codon:yes stop_codon:yes gene_type:complete